MRQFPMRSAKPKNLQLNLLQIKVGLGSKWISDQSPLEGKRLFFFYS